MSSHNSNERDDVWTLAAQVAYDAAGLLACNCSGPCDGSCTHSMAVRLQAAVQAARGERTPASHHDALLREIEHEIRTYGVASLAGLIASSMGALYDPEDDRVLTPREAHYRKAEQAYAELSERLARLARPFDLPDTGGAK